MLLRFSHPLLHFTLPHPAILFTPLIGSQSADIRRAHLGISGVSYIWVSTRGQHMYRYCWQPQIKHISGRNRTPSVLASEAGRVIRIGTYQAHPIKCKIWFRVAPMMLMNGTFFLKLKHCLGRNLAVLLKWVCCHIDFRSIYHKKV